MDAGIGAWEGPGAGARGWAGAIAKTEKVDVDAGIGIWEGPGAGGAGGAGGIA